MILSRCKQTKNMTANIFNGVIVIKVTVFENHWHEVSRSFPNDRDDRWHIFRSFESVKIRTKRRKLSGFERLLRENIWNLRKSINDGKTFLQWLLFFSLLLPAACFLSCFCIQHHVFQPLRRVFLICLEFFVRTVDSFLKFSRVFNFHRERFTLKCDYFNFFDSENCYSWMKLKRHILNVIYYPYHLHFLFL